MTVLLVGTWDTKRKELDWIRAAISQAGSDVVAVDVGPFSTAADVDVRAAQVAEAAGATLESLHGSASRGHAISVMSAGAAELMPRLVSRVGAALAIGGSSGTAIAATAFRALPFGFPKLIASTMASGDVRPYVGESDLMIMHTVTDLAGMNAFSKRVLGNAVNAVLGMERPRPTVDEEERPLVALTMFGITTPAAEEARAALEELGYGVVVFHANGSGGRAMERLVGEGSFAGVLDLTTTELADELVGGVLSAGPERLTAAVQAGIPAVVSTGALDTVNFGPRETVPERFRGRILAQHTPAVTLMKTEPAELSRLARIMTERLSGADSLIELVVPDQAISALGAEGGAFHDPKGLDALIAGLTEGAAEHGIPIHVIHAAINDTGVGRAMAQRLDRLIRTNERTRTNDAARQDP